MRQNSGDRADEMSKIRLYSYMAVNDTGNCLATVFWTFLICNVAKFATVVVFFATPGSNSRAKTVRPPSVGVVAICNNNIGCPSLLCACLLANDIMT